MIKNENYLEINIEIAYKNIQKAYKDVQNAKKVLDTTLNIRNAALALHTAALDNYYSGSQKDIDAYRIAQDNLNEAIILKRKSMLLE